MIECTSLFPEAEYADAHIHDRNTIRINIQRGQRIDSIHMRVDKIANFLERVRREQNQRIGDTSLPSRFASHQCQHGGSGKLILTPYEAHCAAYWLYYDKHVRYKYKAAHIVERGLTSNQCGTSWFVKMIDNSAYESHLKHARSWKDRNRDANRARDVEFNHFKKTPYYKALKATGTDLRILR